MVKVHGQNMKVKTASDLVTFRPVRSPHLLGWHLRHSDSPQELRFNGYEWCFILWLSSYLLWCFRTCFVHNAGIENCCLPTDFHDIGFNDLSTVLLLEIPSPRHQNLTANCISCIICNSAYVGYVGKLKILRLQISTWSWCRLQSLLIVLCSTAKPGKVITNAASKSPSSTHL